MLFRILLLPYVASLSRTVAAAGSPPAQKPLFDADNNVHTHNTAPGPQGGDDDVLSPSPRWSLDFTSPLPHLFASIPSLLHQWSNTIFPNGHTLAAVEIPAYTLLYHGLISPDDPHPEPPNPEWLAFDLEMSYGIMGSSRDSFLLTYQATRPVRALYFDGESAALMGWAQMDTQMLQLFGNTSGPPGGGSMGLGQEYLRAHGLCAWFEEAGLGGRGWGFEGVVRMNAGFEVIWCDFSSPSLRLMSRLNVTAPLLPEGDGDDDDDDDEDGHFRRAKARAASPAPMSDIDALAMTRAHRPNSSPDDQQQQQQQQPTSYYPLPPQPTKTERNSEPSHPAPPPNWRRDAAREPFIRSQGWGWFDSATWHYGSTRNGPGRGEARARVLGCGVLSYYSPRLAGLSRSRALYDRERLNLTADGAWAGESGGNNNNNNNSSNNGNDNSTDRSLAIKQLARRRRFHHLGDVAPEEALLMRRATERALRGLLLEPPQVGGSCSGADWVLITSEIVQRTTDQLAMMDTRLAASLPPGDVANETAVYDWLFGLRGQSHMFMVGYLEYPSSGAVDDPGTWSTKSALYEETYARCRYRYTRLLVPEELRRHGAALSPEEEDIRLAVEEVYGTICSVLLTIGFGIEKAWLRHTDRDGRRPGASSNVAAQTLAAEAGAWRDGITELAAWLGWESEYYGCREVCAWDERCYIPMWPMLAHGAMGGGAPPPPGPPPGGRYPGYGGDGPGGEPGGGRHHVSDAEEDGSPPPGHHHPLPGHNGTGPGGPGFRMPPRGPWWMGDDTDLFEPKCVSIDYIMGQR
ncbi:hypothetical protein VPNG_05390 [Cytospora leucostoma]|uniref:Uncharacterized protein n=1 Tax=Cytospora leucostoma TaxID=1230097 RepID=A0A423X4Z1_9PEZI|nr:hypothetical protein VPNG_05390 [Cytospora leucostoma]